MFAAVSLRLKRLSEFYYCVVFSKHCPFLCVTFAVYTMPPKKKSTSKKPAKARTPTLIDGLTKEEMSKEQLEEHIVHLREELDREREERNYFQLERDHIHSFWEITERNLAEVKAELKNLEKETEEAEGRHRVEIKVYKQKMKHLLCEHQNTIAELKAGGLVSTEMMQKEQEELDTELHKKMKAIMVDIQELDNDTLIRKLELKHDAEMTTIRNEWEKKVTEITANNGKRMQLQRQELDYMGKNATNEMEHQWNSRIAALKEDHDQIFRDAQPIINQMEEDFNAVSVLKAEIASKTEKQKMMENDLKLVTLDNLHLAKNISKVEVDNAVVEKKVKYYSAKKDPSNTIEKLKKKELENLKREHEVLGEKFTKLQMERDELYKTFPQNIQKMQHKAHQATMLLEKKLQALTDSVEDVEARLCSVLSASNIDQTALSGVINKVEENLISRNTAIKTLQHKKNLIAKARRDLLLYIEVKQRALGVPVEELCVNP
ncbi:dynein regulatory complex subunit 4-like [Acanthochromis polyacanthus]|uniref:Dynein regulatory complex subunit 4 n=1 Tax=Acanthochromis polyacanthus TaxID=80966 RepID=A0A3Q1F2V6_9TELE|nr:dynein regulatory complex subunit 4-like [Acanthochromis polyacanthus]